MNLSDARIVIIITSYISSYIILSLKHEQYIYTRIFIM